MDVDHDRLKREIAATFGTPSVVIDLDVVERNIARVQSMYDRAGLANRPHIKTHKSPVIAAMQRDAGARGITCQKLGEAEIFADAGFDDILITYNIVGADKVERLGALMRRAHMTVAVDNRIAIGGLPRAAEISGETLDVVVECDTGRNRAGVTTPAEAIALAQAIDATQGLRFAGLMLYAPEDKVAETQAFFDEASAGIAAAGLDLAMVTNGGTPNLANLGRIAGVTEHRAGTYVFNDRMMLAANVARIEDCAMTILATVVSRAADDRGVLDAGSKTLTADTGKGLDGHGFIFEHPQARIAWMAEEHGVLDLKACNDRPKVGDLLRIVPNHTCVVANMVDAYVTVRGDELIGELPVAARGKLR